MANEEPAMIYIGWTDPLESTPQDIITVHTRLMLGSEDLYSDQLVVDFKKGGRVFRKGDILYVDALVDASDDWVVATSRMQIPVTIKNTRTGKYEDADIELTGKYKFTTAADTLVTLSTARLRIATYTIPEGMSLVLGKQRAHNSRLLVVLRDT